MADFLTQSQIQAVILYLRAIRNLRQSSPELASLAGRVLQDPNSDVTRKRLSGSVLSQAQRDAIKKILAITKLAKMLSGKAGKHYLSTCSSNHVLTYFSNHVL